MGEFDFNEAFTNTQGPSSSSGNTAINISTVNDYSFVEQAYKGSGGFKDGTYLIAHKREGFYIERKQFSHYTNFVQPILRAMIEPVFNSPVRREFDDNELFKIFMKDVNYNNLHIQDFTQLVTKYARLHSIVFIVMDYIFPDDIELTEQYLLENNIHPYVYIKKAWEVDSYKLDFFGRLEEIVFCDEKQTIKVNGKEEQRQTYIRWTITNWERVIKEKDKYIILETRIHNLGVLPVSAIYENAREDTKILLTESKFYALAKINHTIYNQDSERRELQRNQAFAILYIPEEDNDVAGKAIGTNNYLAISMDAPFAPGFISPDTNILKVLQEQREDNKKDLFTLADQLGVIGITKEAKSGIALSYEFSAYESTLQKTSDIAIKVENAIVRLFQLYTNTNFEYTAKYNTEYQIGKEENKIKIYDTVQEWQNVPDGLNRLIVLDTTRLLFPEVGDKVIEAIEREMIERKPEFTED